MTFSQKTFINLAILGLVIAALLFGSLAQAKPPQPPVTVIDEFSPEHFIDGYFLAMSVPGFSDKRYPDIEILQDEDRELTEWVLFEGEPTSRVSMRVITITLATWGDHSLIGATIVPINDSESIFSKAIMAGTPPFLATRRYNMRLPVSNTKGSFLGVIKGSEIAFENARQTSR